MTEAWRASKLGDVCRIDLGRTPSRANSAYWDKERQTGNVWLSIADLLGAEGNVVNDSREYLSEEGAAISKFVRKGTLLASFKLTLGRLAFAGRDLFTNEAIAALTVLNEQELSKEFLFFYLQFFDWDGATGGDVKLKGKTLNKAKLLDIRVSYPSLPKQWRIVGLLEDALRRVTVAEESARASLRNARDLRDSLMQQVLSQGCAEEWLETTIGECVRFIDYRGRTPKKTSGGLRLITAKNVKMGYLQVEPIEYVAPETYENWMTRGIPRAGDVLFTTEAPLANVAQLDTNEKVVFAQRIIIMQPDDAKLDRAFLKYLLLSPSVQQRIHTRGTGATAKGIKASLLKTVAISFPESIAGQRELVDALDALLSDARRLESVQQRKIVALGDLRRSLLHQAFTGRLKTVV